MIAIIHIAVAIGLVIIGICVFGAGVMSGRREVRAELRRFAVLDAWEAPACQCEQCKRRREYVQ